MELALSLCFGQKLLRVGDFFKGFVRTLEYDNAPFSTRPYYRAALPFFCIRIYDGS